MNSTIEAAARLRVLLVSSELPQSLPQQDTESLLGQVGPLRRKGVKFDLMPFAGATKPAAYLSARRELRSRLSSRIYHLIHAEHGHCALIALGCGAPIVLTVHETDLGTSADQRGVYRLALPQLNRWVARRVAAVVAPSARTALRLPVGVRSHVIPWGIDPGIFRPGSKEDARRDLNLPAGRRLVLWWEPSSQRRWSRTIFDAMNGLRARVDADLVVLPRTGLGDTARYLTAADVFLATSAGSLASLAVKRALACGVPVVWAGGDADELDSTSGCDCVADDPRMIARALERLLVSARAVDAHEIAERYSERRIAEMLLAVYREVLGRPFNRPPSGGTDR